MNDHDTLYSFLCRLYAQTDEEYFRDGSPEVPDHLQAEWEVYCRHIEFYHMAKMHAGTPLRTVGRDE